VRAVTSALGRAVALGDRLRRRRGAGDDLQARHRAALKLIRSGSPASPQPAGGRELPDSPRLPEVNAADLDPEVLRSAIVQRGCLLVRGLVDPDEAEALRGEVDVAFASRERVRAGEDGDGYYEEFEPEEGFELAEHRWMISGPSSLWLADSPRVTSSLLRLCERTGFDDLATTYLGERPAISINKSTLRKVAPETFADEMPSMWHQDGAFLGDVRALNLWLALTPCGDVAPGMDVIPRRLDEIVPTGTHDAQFDWSVSHEVAAQTAGDSGVVTPVFAPGDALLFDEMLLHSTSGTAEMPSTRYAIECWFFGPSAFPEDYAPILL
jgi:hypothetical protein